MEEMEFDIDKLFEEVSSNAASSTKNVSLKNATTITSKGVAAATTSKDAAAITTKDPSLSLRTLLVLGL